MSIWDTPISKVGVFLWGAELGSCPVLVLRNCDPRPLSVNTHKTEN